jgi:hypothetical protein
MVTLKPLACKSFANEAETIPLPNEEVTPPVTKMYLVIRFKLLKISLAGWFWSRK